MAAAPSGFPLLDSTFEVDKLTQEIFSILENRFLFGSDEPKTQPIQLQDIKPGKHFTGKVRILSIDGGGSTDGVLAAKSLVQLEAFLRQKSGNPNASIAEYFDVVAGSGAGGILAALLFTRGGKDGCPMFSAEEALDFLVKNRAKIFRPTPGGIIRRIFRPSKAEKVLRRTFRELTLKDTLKPVLIPCYDLSSQAAFVFSRADALEMDSYDFEMSDVCLATSADPTVVKPLEKTSVDRRTKIVAVDGGIAMNNPTAAAITHVLNNKQEFPLCNGVEDLLVLSLGNGESDFGAGNLSRPQPTFVRIAGDGASDMVDQAVSMAFGEHRESNYVRVQGNCLEKLSKQSGVLSIAETMLQQKNVESVLFGGKKMGKITNAEKLEKLGGELMTEQERRKRSILPVVVLKNGSMSPRTSSATSLSTMSSN